MTGHRSLLILFMLASLGAADGSTELQYSPAPPDNPLKGFAPYARRAADFPHSLEFGYLPLRNLMTGPHQFDWKALDQLIEDVSSRHCQTVFRIYVEYPGQASGVPQFIIDGGLKITDYQDRKNRANHTPDYGNPILRSAMVEFIKAMGQRYDGDPRIGYITAGLLGYWGEWHTSERKELWASEDVQREIMDAYEAAFKQTPVLLRYPAANSNRASMAANADRPFGYHDDSFAYATMPTTRPSDSWYFMALMQSAGKEAIEKWRTHPIGGEVRPEVWAGLWDEKSSTPVGQEFLKCVEATHATWMMDSSINRKLDKKQRERAITGERRLGYELFVSSAAIKFDRASGELSVSLTVKNTGVAPFYRDWTVEMGAIDGQGRLMQVWKPGWKINVLQPDDPTRSWEFRTSASALPAGRLKLAVHVPNPMPGGYPVRFANATQDADLAEWLTVGEIQR